MSAALRILQGKFGRVALLDMNMLLVAHAHHHCHVLIKAYGADTFFSVRGQPQPLTNDSAILVNAWEPHSYNHNGIEVERTVILALYIEPNWLAAIQQTLMVSAHPHFFQQPCVALPVVARRAADALARDMLLSVELSPTEIEERLFNLMIATIERNSEWRSYQSLLSGLRLQQSDVRIRKAIAMMRASPGQNLDMDVIATECGLSRAHFFELFKKSTNLTPRVYANVLRMESAIDSLTSGETAIADLAYDMGFSAPGHFTRFFREHLGTTPKEYRRVVDVVDLR
ncbi:UNVERIFIED_CONTAM: AraC family transcriptional regulator [Comamonas sp. A-3]|uniref:helix-turn-helix domain-containing protein n=1 Tax=unclassified Comamonas TaxID=2638500 RepID=UPI0012C421F4|nr:MULTISPECIES: AraC family transcriptional regulator [Comamonas]MPT12908.1 AraC family transcriptional regulator [Comamonas sp.]UUC92716.1 AraC family transcriptional regulator [Comamonas sp. C11]